MPNWKIITSASWNQLRILNCENNRQSYFTQTLSCYSPLDRKECVLFPSASVSLYWAEVQLNDFKKLTLHWPWAAQVGGGPFTLPCRGLNFHSQWTVLNCRLKRVERREQWAVHLYEVLCSWNIYTWGCACWKINVWQELIGSIPSVSWTQRWTAVSILN